MAGDWIKVECSTPDKPEVGRLADLLGVDPDEALGKLVRFWAWWDSHSRNARVTHAYGKTIETVMRCPGFVAAMADVGWLEVDDKTGVVTIPNPDRHNGTPAKSRALSQKRQEKYRNAHVTIPLRSNNADGVTREDKNRSKIKNDVDVMRTVGVTRPASGQGPSLDIQSLRAAVKSIPSGPQRSREEQMEAVRLDALRIPKPPDKA